MNSGIRKKSDTHQAWVLDQQRAVAKCVAMLVDLLEELGKDLVFSPQSPEIGLVRNLLRIALEVGGEVALDSVCRRVQSHLAEDELDPDGSVMAALLSRIADVGGRG